jgi:DNA-binding CsgD family transcriptional regulator
MSAAAPNAQTRLAEAIAALNQPEFPARLAKFLHACAPHDNLGVFAYLGEARPLVLHTSHAASMVRASLREYVEAAYLLDPFFRAHLARVPAGIYSLHDVAPDQFKRSAYYRSYYRKTTITDEICAVAYVRSGYTVQVSLGMDISSARTFSRRDRAALKAQERVICALMARHWHDLQAQIAEDVPHDDAAIAGKLIRVLQGARGIELSVRQAEVALMILQGHSSASIALKLGISPQTVKVHRKLLYAKCRICSQAELFAMMLPIMAASRAGGLAVAAAL